MNFSASIEKITSNVQCSDAIIMDADLIIVPRCLKKVVTKDATTQTDSSYFAKMSRQSVNILLFMQTKKVLVLSVNIYIIQFSFVQRYFDWSDLFC